MKTCEGCKKLREDIVKALETVDCLDWDSYNGQKDRSVSSILSDIATRLSQLGAENEE